ncbi:MAG: hypothetical protein IPN01_05350 [Deltaproteobacteria bacterium]|nr:hypothetical protein [Deltaproteobacteria bacterium]
MIRALLVFSLSALLSADAFACAMRMSDGKRLEEAIAVVEETKAPTAPTVVQAAEVVTPPAPLVEPAAPKAPPARAHRRRAHHLIHALGPAAAPPGLGLCGRAGGRAAGPVHRPGGAG